MEGTSVGRGAETRFTAAPRPRNTSDFFVEPVNREGVCTRMERGVGGCQGWQGSGDVAESAERARTTSSVRSWRRRFVAA